MPKKSGRDFSGPAQKYVGQVKIDSGPVPLQRWQKPLTREQRDRPLGSEGIDLRPERPERQSKPPPRTHKGPNYTG